MKTLMLVRGAPVQQLDDGSISFIAGMTIDADGSPRCYAPPPLRGLDFLSNAGCPGNWWALVTNAAGHPVTQGPGDPAPGFYVSSTSYERAGFDHADPRRYLDSESEKFIVVPAPLRHLVRPVVLGCRALVRHLSTGQEVEAVVGDLGPASHLGEASIALARAFHLHADPRTGGTDTACFHYKIFPGEPAPGYELQPA